MPPTLSSLLMTEIESAERDMWALHTKLGGAGYDTTAAQLRDMRRLGAMADDIDALKRALHTVNMRKEHRADRASDHAAAAKAGAPKGKGRAPSKPATVPPAPEPEPVTVSLDPQDDPFTLPDEGDDMFPDIGDMDGATLPPEARP